MEYVDLARAAKELELERRLRNTPSSARARGIFFNMLRDEMHARGLMGVREIAAFLRRPYKTYALYPVSDLVEAYAVAGALVRPCARDGMREIFFGTTRYVTRTWYGRVFSRHITGQPVDALQWLTRSREYIANFGEWRLEPRGEHAAIMHHFDEYFWIEALRGGCEGLLEVCGVQGTVDLDLDSPFSGRFHIRWEPYRIARSS